MQRVEIIPPSFGENEEHCVLVRWHVPDASMVEAGDLIATLETKKVITEMEAECDGRLLHHSPEGATLKLGHAIGCIESNGLKKVNNSLFLTVEITQADLDLIDALRGEDSRNEFVLRRIRTK